MEPYYIWVRIRAQKLGMPYEAVRPIILEILEITNGAGLLSGKVQQTGTEDPEADQAIGE